MRRRVLFVHGGGEGAYEQDLRMAASLRDTLGGGYEVLCPKMPDADSPNYAAWRDHLESELAGSEGEIYLVGHSLGDSILLKYLSEEEVRESLPESFSSPHLSGAPRTGRSTSTFCERTLP